MFLRANKRFKDGKEHRYWSVVENRRVAGGRSVQKTLLYLGGINDSGRALWPRAIEAVDERGQSRQIHLFPEDRTPDSRLEHPSLRLRLDHIELSRPRQWGGCWLALELRPRLDLDAKDWQQVKGDLGLRPVFHQLDGRTSEIQMLDVGIPATDGREVRMKRHTKPEKIHHLLLDELGFTLPAQPPPEIRKSMPVVETIRKNERDPNDSGPKNHLTADAGLTCALCSRNWFMISSTAAAAGSPGGNHADKQALVGEAAFVG